MGDGGVQAAAVPEHHGVEDESQAGQLISLPAAVCLPDLAPAAVADGASKPGWRDRTQGALDGRPETADTGSPAYRVAAEHKESVTAYVAGLLADSGHPEAAELARQFVLLMHGAIVTALRERTTAPAHEARAMAACHARHRGPRWGGPPGAMARTTAARPGGESCGVDERPGTK
nr:hypothetical protein [Streptomyces sp. ISL-10]